MKYTVITSVFNQVKYLDLIYEGMKAQTVKDWELIIADDGSEDHPDKWAKKHGVKFVSQKKDGMRLAKIMNQAIALSEGENIVTVMGDSVPGKHLLEEYDKVMEAGVVGNGLRVFVKDPLPLDKIGSEENFIEKDWRANQIGMIGMTDKPWRMFTGNNLCITRIDYERIKAKNGFYWNEEYVGYGLEDWELGINLWELRCEFVACPEALVYHISHPKREESENNQLLHYKKLKELYEKYGIK